MLRSQQNNLEPEDNRSSPPSQQLGEGETGNFDIQQELNRLEEMILASFRIPLVGRTLVDEEKLLEQLDLIRLSLPNAFEIAAEIIQHKQEIFLEAEEYGQQIVEAAQVKRAQILEENDIIRQAQMEAEQLRRQVQQECDARMQQTLEEIERQRRQCQQEIEQMQKQALAEAEIIERGADEYADSVLENIENDLNEMTQIIRNGRQQLGLDRQPQKNLPSQKKK